MGEVAETVFLITYEVRGLGGILRYDMGYNFPYKVYKTKKNAIVGIKEVIPILEQILTSKFVKEEHYHIKSDFNNESCKLVYEVICEDENKIEATIRVTEHQTL